MIFAHNSSFSCTNTYINSLNLTSTVFRTKNMNCLQQMWEQGSLYISKDQLRKQFLTNKTKRNKLVMEFYIVSIQSVQYFQLRPTGKKNLSLFCLTHYNSLSIGSFVIILSQRKHHSLLLSCSPKWNIYKMSECKFKVTSLNCCCFVQTVKRELPFTGQ